MFDYCPFRSSPILVNFGSLGVTAAALFPGCMRASTGCRLRLPARLSRNSELGAVALWGSQNWGRRRCLRPFGGICIFQAADALVMAALYNRAGHYIFVLRFLSSICLVFSSPNLSGRRLNVCHTSTHGVALVQI